MSAELDRFLARAGWADATRAPLAGDASARRYLRLRRNTGESAVLMIDDSPPETALAPFLRVTALLRGLGFSAPEVLAEEAPLGLVLLEDLGDRCFARETVNGGAAQLTLYTEAARFLAALHAASLPPGLALPRFTPQHLAAQALLALDWPALPLNPGDREDLAHAVADVLADMAPQVLVLRDMHAENLVWLPERAGVARVGLLDYQDAGLGHPAYDLASLLHDARRDVPLPVARATIRTYLDATGLEEAPFLRAFHALSAQRNLRIRGIFHRLAQRDGKTRYLAFLPRVEAHLARDLSQPGLEPLARAVGRVLPALGAGAGA